MEQKYAIHVHPDIVTGTNSTETIMATKRTSAAEVVNSVVSRLQFKDSKSYVLVEMHQQRGEEMVLASSDCPVQRMLLWPRQFQHSYKFILRQIDKDGMVMYNGATKWQAKRNEDTEQRNMVLKGFLPPEQLSQDDNPDLCLLSDLTQEKIMNVLKLRFAKDKIYTYSGEILISINPYKFLAIYNPKYMTMYQNRKKDELEPHIYAIADSAFTQMVEDKKNQCVVITGKSGSGKTQATHFLVHHTLALCQKSYMTGVEHMLVGCVPVLEALGNAQTEHNNNSSRFGKFLRIYFYESGLLSGADIQTYLLEKSRLVHQGLQERNFHIFYYLLRGANEDTLKEVHLDSRTTYNYVKNDMMNSNEAFAELERLKQAMEVVGFFAGAQRNIFKLIAAILLLGNITFRIRKGREESLEIEDESYLLSVSALLQLDASIVRKCLMTRKAKAGAGERFILDLKLNEAQATRDAMAKALYQSLFDWVVNSINMALAQRTRDSKLRAQSRWIGLLDIFGFEDFVHNSFEQFCINYASEHLQHHCVKHTFQVEQELYKTEGLDWKEVTYADNSGCLELYEKKPTGLFYLIDENFPGANNQTLLAQFNRVHSSNPYYESTVVKEDAFIIKHYAGKVKYQIKNFREKNHDQVREDIILMLRTSKSSFIQDVIAKTPAAVFRWAVLRAVFRAAGAFRKSKDLMKGHAKHQLRTLWSQESQDSKEMQYSYVHKKLRARLSHRRSERPPESNSSNPYRETVSLYGKRKAPAPSRTKKKTNSIGQQHQASLASLMGALDKAHPFFVRCIQPNNKKIPRQLDEQLVLHQLRCSGTLQTIQLQQSRYPFHFTPKQFHQEYKLLFPASTKSLNLQQVSSFLKSIGLVECTHFQIGSTTAFLRTHANSKLRETLHLHVLRSVLLCQACARRFIARRRYERLQYATVKIQSLWRMVEAQRRIEEWHLAASIIQEAWQNHRRRKWEKHIVLLQAHCRGYLARRRVKKRLRAIKVIQRSWRSYALRCRSAVLIQRVVRGFLARRLLARMRLEQEAEKALEAQKRDEVSKQEESQAELNRIAIEKTPVDSALEPKDVSSNGDVLVRRSSEGRLNDIEKLLQTSPKIETLLGPSTSGRSPSIRNARSTESVLSDDRPTTPAMKKQLSAGNLLAGAGLNRFEPVDQLPPKAPPRKVDGNRSDATSPSDVALHSAGQKTDYVTDSEPLKVQQKDQTALPNIPCDITEQQDVVPKTDMKHTKDQKYKPSEKPTATPKRRTKPPTPSKPSELKNFKFSINSDLDSSLNIEQNQPPDNQYTRTSSQPVTKGEDRKPEKPNSQTSFTPKTGDQDQQPEAQNTATSYEPKAGEVFRRAATPKRSVEALKPVFFKPDSIKRNTALDEINKGTLDDLDGLPFIDDESYDLSTPLKKQLGDEGTFRYLADENRPEKSDIPHTGNTSTPQKPLLKSLSYPERQTLKVDDVPSAVIQIPARVPEGGADEDKSVLSPDQVHIIAGDGEEITISVPRKSFSLPRDLKRSEEIAQLQKEYIAFQKMERQRQLRDLAAVHVTKRENKRDRRIRDELTSLRLEQMSMLKEKMDSYGVSFDTMPGVDLAPLSRTASDITDTDNSTPPTTPLTPAKETFTDQTPQKVDQTAEQGSSTDESVFPRSVSMESIARTSHGRPRRQRSNSAIEMLSQPPASDPLSRKAIDAIAFAKKYSEEDRVPSNSSLVEEEEEDEHGKPKRADQGEGKRGTFMAAVRKTLLGSHKPRNHNHLVEKKSNDSAVSALNDSAISPAPAPAASKEDVESVNIRALVAEEVSTKLFVTRTDELLLLDSFIKDKMMNFVGSNQIDQVFKKALDEFCHNLTAVYSLTELSGDTNGLRYKDIINNFRQVLEKTAKNYNLSGYAAMMAVNGFRGYMNEFMNDVLPKHVVKESRSKRKKSKDDVVSRKDWHGHIFAPVQWGVTQVCESCSNVMWLMEAGMVCKVCKFACHKKCLKQLTQKCSGLPDGGKEQGRPKKLFGEALISLVDADSLVPVFIDKCISYMEMNGIYQEGIYRKSAAATQIKQLEDLLNKDIKCEKINFDDYQIHTVAAVFKKFLRALAQPLVPFDKYFEFLQASRLTDEREKVNSLFCVLDGIPQHNHATLERIVFHLARVAQQEPTNRMSPNNLAIVFTPCFISPPPHVPPIEAAAQLGDMTKGVEVVISTRVQNIRNTLESISEIKDVESSAQERLLKIRQSMGKGKRKRIRPSFREGPRSPIARRSFREHQLDSVEEEEDVDLALEEQKYEKRIATLRSKKETLTSELASLTPQYTNRNGVFFDYEPLTDAPPASNAPTANEYLRHLTKHRVSRMPNRRRPTRYSSPIFNPAPAPQASPVAPKEGKHLRKISKLVRNAKVNQVDSFTRTSVARHPIHRPHKKRDGAAPAGASPTKRYPDLVKVTSV